MTTETKIKTISYSQVQTYLTCPLRYKLSYVDDLKPGFTTDSLLLGSAIHRALETCMKRYQADGKLMRCTELQQEFTNILRYELNHNEVRFSNGWRPENLIRVGCNMLSFWRSTFASDLLSIDKVVAVEERFCLEAISPDTGHPLSRKITGVIDLILKLHRWPGSLPGEKVYGKTYPGLNVWLLLDHKTSVQRFPEFKIDRDWQLTLYQWAAIKLGLIPDRDLTVVGFSLLTKKVRPEFHLLLSRRKQYQETQMLRLFSRVLDAIEMEIFYPNLNHIHCKNCPYLDSFCLEW